jgi:hypothetical protein
MCGSRTALRCQSLNSADALVKLEPQHEKPSFAIRLNRSISTPTLMLIFTSRTCRFSAQRRNACSSFIAAELPRASGFTKKNRSRSACCCGAPDVTGGRVVPIGGSLAA